MRRRLVGKIVCLVVASAVTGGAALSAAPSLVERRRGPAGPSAETEQRGRTTARKPAPAPKPVPKVAPADVTCPEQLGTGLKTKHAFCFVLAGRDPTEGVIVRIPPHSHATLTFDLHNRHTYSEEEVKAGRGYARYTAVIGVLSMTGMLLGRGAVQTEFRTARDLYDRITALVPPGPAPLLDATTSAGREVATPGRPVAIVSNLQVEYLPAPVKRR